MNVSVVIPAYNAEAFIIAAMDSVAWQQPPPAEMIVVDDGSRDTTANLVAAWISGHPGLHTRLLAQPNGGISAARNAGISAASGDWIALLDADDVWERDHLAQLEAALRKAPQAIAAYGAGRLLVDDEVRPGYYDAYWDSPALVLGIPIAGSDCMLLNTAIVERLIRGNFIKPTSLMMLRAAALAAGLFDVTLRASEDREFLVRLIFEGDFIYTPKAISQYRWHSNNSTAEKNTLCTMAWGLMALQVIGRDRSKLLNQSQRLTVRKEVDSSVRTYLYTSARRGGRQYAVALRLVWTLFGGRCLLRGTKLKHLAHFVLATGGADKT
jgi:glycosyltransferase involved in cell wall biosynthesis